MRLHAFDGYLLFGLDGLGLEHLGESALSQLADEAVLCEVKLTITYCAYFFI